MYFIKTTDIRHYLPPAHLLKVASMLIGLSVIISGYAFHYYKNNQRLKNQLQQYQQKTIVPEQEMSLQKHKLKNSILFQAENRVALLQILEKIEQKGITNNDWQVDFSIAEQHQQGLWQISTIKLKIGLKRETQLFELLDFLTQREGVLSPMRCDVQQLKTGAATANCQLQWLTVTAAGKQAFND